ncbi:hypothetical protein [Marinigracilibium pacificum]|uniref:Nucleic acid-binding protein n=1 Tax=Marinigracilibium pacificum TaxID=2729599 RepID=A0A848J5U8_9BACT|nr:hypothetical protein [Marinigracilibium pacificum]NMM49844.1 hypothetical protein [Marinigracilibium pacificum]
MESKNRIILIDTDVISHFILGGAILTLPKIFPHYKIKMVDKVYDELSRFKRKKQEVDNLIKFKLIEVMDFPEDEEIMMEYFYIKKSLFKGDGEAASLAIVRHSKDILASSNLKDIAHYCKMHSIDYLTTMDFLCEALKKNIMTENECDNFIQRVKSSGSKLPVNYMSEYSCKDKL